MHFDFDPTSTTCVQGTTQEIQGTQTLSSKGLQPSWKTRPKNIRGQRNSKYPSGHWPYLVQEHATLHVPSGIKVMYPWNSRRSSFSSRVSTPNTHTQWCNSYKTSLQLFSAEMAFPQNKFLDKVWKYKKDKSLSDVVKLRMRGRWPHSRGPLWCFTLQLSLDTKDFM